ncbi:MAG: Benzoyl-CoA-dihydrodiol lyase [Planctomycetes bacterium]|nr:Benzoyl-CoA-dihydrodiol lyase [Planctomycetota bacterium]
MAETAAKLPEIRFGRRPESYVHWKLEFQGDVARLRMAVQEDRGLNPDTVLKLNSYDLGVDLELADAVQRIRFEHPEVRCLVVTSVTPRIFCAGANIPMLASSGHAFKVNFCKFTNETRLYLEDLSAASGVRTLCAVNGTASGGGYELALACDWIMLPEDGNTAVSFPEVPLLGVLPGTGGLTRLVDKRKVRRDLADVFSSLAEGVKGRRAVEWRLVDEVVPSSQFQAAVERRARILADESAQATPLRAAPGVPLPDLACERDDARDDGGATTFRWAHVTMKVLRGERRAEIEVRAPESVPSSLDEIRAQAAGWWALRCFRELDEALLQLRFNFLDVGLVLVRTKGEAAQVIATDELLQEHAGDWFVGEVRHQIRRVLKRLDVTARSLFAVIEPGSCFAGTLFELVLASDRTYMLDHPDEANHVQLSEMNGGAYPMANGLSRLDTHFLGEPEKAREALSVNEPVDAATAMKMGLVTFAPDDIDWEDELRLAVEERSSLSPDALTGMEANLRFAGPETMETKIFGRLSAWQNWIFQRPNAVGERGALTSYGKPQRPEFDWRRT